jgi:adenine-specific DNA-methyltransferase
MTKYICDICSKSFGQKGHFENHKNRVNPCKKNEILEEIVEKKVKEALSKTNEAPTHIETNIRSQIITPTMDIKKNEIKHKKNLGQYFTISDELQTFVFDNVKYKSSLLLEPSFGAGHLLKKFKEYNENYPILCYELDDKVTPVITFNQFQTPIYGDFTKQVITQKFKTIVGNPPYVKQRTGNLYIKFIELCYEYLDENGELIFIVPSDFIKLTSASCIIDKMTENGSFTDFLFPNNENLFEGASIDIVVFRYEKGLKNKKTKVNGKEVFCNINKGIITFSDSVISGLPIYDKFNVYVGLVSGRDEIYRVPFGNIDILNDKDRVEKYIFTETFPTKISQIDTHLQTHKTKLLERKIKKFTEDNWFEWGAPRNISSIKKYWDKPCIYLRNMTRNKEVAFSGKVQFFGGTLLCLVPKYDMTETEIKSIIQYINSPIFQKDYIYAGRFKIGHKQISNAIVPY